jgi:hypothetical protein
MGKDGEDGDGHGTDEETWEETSEDWVEFSENIWTHTAGQNCHGERIQAHRDTRHDMTGAKKGLALRVRVRNKCVSSQVSRLDFFLFAVFSPGSPATATFLGCPAASTASVLFARTQSHGSAGLVIGQCLFLFLPRPLLSLPKSALVCPCAHRACVHAVLCIDRAEDERVLILRIELTFLAASLRLSLPLATRPRPRRRWLLPWLSSFSLASLLAGAESFPGRKTFSQSRRRRSVSQSLSPQAASATLSHSYSSQSLSCSCRLHTPVGPTAFT